MLTGVELGVALEAKGIPRQTASYHHGLALVLDDMARAADLVPAAEAEKLQLVGRVDGLFRLRGRQRGGFPLGRHDVERGQGATD